MQSVHYKRCDMYREGRKVWKEMFLKALCGMEKLVFS